MGTGGYNKTLSMPGASIFIMSSRKSKKHQFRPAMDEVVQFTMMPISRKFESKKKDNLFLHQNPFNVLAKGRGLTVEVKLI